MLLLFVYLHIIFFLYKKITFSHFCEKKVSGNKQKSRKSDENKGRCVRVHSFPAHMLGEVYTFSSQWAPRRKREAHWSGFECKKRNPFFHLSQSNIKEKHLCKNPSTPGAPKSSRLCSLVRVLARDRLRSCWTARTSLSSPSAEPSSSLWHGSSFFPLLP